MIKKGERLCLFQGYFMHPKKHKHCFRFRMDPVPFVNKEGIGIGRGHSPKKNNEMRQTAVHEKTTPVKIRAKRRYSKINQFFHWSSGHYRTWKNNKKIKKQWMKKNPGELSMFKKFEFQ